MLIFGASFTLTACADVERGQPIPDAAPSIDQAVTDQSSTDNTASDGSSDGTTTALSYETAVHPILTAKCAGCHGSSGSASSSKFVVSGTIATDYQTVLNLIDVKSPTESALLKKGSGQGHGGGSILSPSSTEYQTIEQWISDGAAP